MVSGIVASRNVPPNNKHAVKVLVRQVMHKICTFHYVQRCDTLYEEEDKSILFIFFFL